MDQARAAKSEPSSVGGNVTSWSVVPPVMGRAIVAVPAAMAVWWFLLKPVSLWLLRTLGWLPLALLVAPPHLDPIRADSQGWVFNIAVNQEVTNPQTGQRQRIESVEFVAAEDNVAFFACGWFSYLALAWSVTGFAKSQAQRILRGLGLQTVISILSLAAYAYINGYGSLLNVPGSTNWVVWFYKYVYHLIYLVVPFVGPFAIALLVHSEWRACFTVPAPREGHKKGSLR